MSVIGTWRDDIKVDQEEFKKYVEMKGRKYVIDNIVTRCPTNAISLNAVSYTHLRAHETS